VCVCGGGGTEQIDLERKAMDTLVAEHLYREGRAQAAQYIVQASDIELPHEDAYRRLYAVQKVCPSH